MTIAEARGKCKALAAGGHALVGRARATLKAAPRDVLVVLALVLASSASYGLGILTGESLSAGEGMSISQESLTAAALPRAEAALSASSSLPAGGQVVASKNGTKYYLPWCSGASRISNANKVWFASASAAKAAGYQPSTSCKGL